MQKLAEKSTKLHILGVVMGVVKGKKYSLSQIVDIGVKDIDILLAAGCSDMDIDIVHNLLGVAEDISGILGGKLRVIADSGELVAQLMRCAAQLMGGAILYPALMICGLTVRSFTVG